MNDICFPIGNLAVEQVVRPLNPRFCRNDLTRKALLRIISKLREADWHSLTEQEKAIRGLLWACAQTGSRIEEYTGDLLTAGVARFFFEKAIQLSSRAVNVPLPPSEEKSYDLKSSVDYLISVKERIPRRLVRLHRFTSDGPTVVEDFIQPVVVEDSSASIQVTDTHEGVVRIDYRAAWDCVIKTMEQLTPVDVVILTAPNVVDTVRADAWDFACHFGDGRGQLTWLHKRVISSRMVGHKRRERIEVMEPGYTKRYCNLSTYEVCGSAPRGHRFIGFSHACRYILDIEIDNGMLWGLSDIRAIRFVGPPFESAELAAYQSVGKRLENLFSRALQGIGLSRRSSTIDSAANNQ